MVGTDTLPNASPEEMDEMDKSLLSTLRSLKESGKEVYLILDSPFGEELDPHSMIERRWGSVTVKVPDQLPRDVALDRTEPVRSRIMRIASITGSHTIDPFNYLCDDKFCSAFSKEGELLYKDYDHLSLFASVNKVRYLDFLAK